WVAGDLGGDPVDHRVPSPSRQTVNPLEPLSGRIATEPAAPPRPYFSSRLLMGSGVSGTNSPRPKSFTPKTLRSPGEPGGGPAIEIFRVASCCFFPIMGKMIHEDLWSHPSLPLYQT